MTSRSRLTHRIWRVVFPFLFLIGCRHDDTEAWGNFEATEIRVAAEIPGRLMQLLPAEGSDIVAGSIVAQVDTTGLAVQRGEILARQATIRAHYGEIAANTASLQSQLDLAIKELERTRRLKAADAATAQQVDRAERDVSVLQHQVQSVLAGRQVVDEEVRANATQMTQLLDRLHRGVVMAPLSGTVLTRFSEPGEMVQPGTPLIAIASLDTLTFRAYLGGDQLTRLHVGSQVWVRVDAGQGTLKAHPGTVTWIASTAEFTPTPIQTRDERTTQVYAVKIAVPNPDRALRIGMPGELRFTADSLPR